MRKRSLNSSRDQVGLNAREIKNYSSTGLRRRREKIILCYPRYLFAVINAYNGAHRTGY